MAITINTNMASITAQHSLSKATSGMDKAMERLSTGLKINSSKDDAAGSAVVTKLDYKISSLSVAQDNAQMGSSLLDTSEGTLDVIQSNMQRIRDLTEQAANGTYGSDAMTAIKAEISGRLDEVTRISGSTEFNGKNLLDGSMTNGINLQVGIMADENSVITLDKSLFASAKSNDLLGNYVIKGDGDGNAVPADGKEANIVTFGAGVYAKVGQDFFKVYNTDKLALMDKAGTEAAATAYKTATDKTNSNATFKFTTAESAAGSTAAADNLNSIFRNDITAQSFLNNIDTALADITSRKTDIGASQQRIASAMEVAGVMETNLTSASSLIKDADIAKESSNYIKQQILQQTAASLLATANQNPSIATSLV